MFFVGYAERSHEQMTINDLKELGSIEKQAKSYYGTRVPMFQSGKKTNEMVFHNKPKRYYSANKQVEDLQSYNKNRSDKRQVYIATAQKKEKPVEILLHDFIYEIMLNSKDEKEFQEKMKNEGFLDFPEFIENLREKDAKKVWTGYLMFNFDEIDNKEHLQYITERLNKSALGILPELAYEDFIINGTSKDKKMALRYGIVKEFQHYKVLTTKASMPHWFQTYNTAIRETSSRYGGEYDCYLSAATFVQFKRQIDFVAELSQLYCDIDYYTIPEYENMSQTKVIDLCLKALDERGIPRPTNTEVSRGFTFKWKISPIGYHRRGQWLELQEEIFKVLKPFGADYKVTKDIVRLSRQVGSYHSGTNKMVYGIRYSDDRYNFENLFETMLPERWKQILQTREIAKELAKKKYELIKGGKAKDTKKTEKVVLDDGLTPKHVAQNYKHIHYIRALEELIAHREGSMTGYREFSVFLYRYWWLCLTGSKLKALNKAKNLFFAMNIEGAYTWSEVEQLTISAERAWEKWTKDAYKGYNYKPETLIKELGITKEEQYHVHYLRSEEVQKERKKVMDREKKKENYQKELEKTGKLSREEQKALRIEQIKSFLNDNPNATQREIAKGTGISQSAIQRLLVEIKG